MSLFSALLLPLEHQVLLPLKHQVLHPHVFDLSRLHSVPVLPADLSWLLDRSQPPERTSGEGGWLGSGKGRRLALQLEGRGAFGCVRPQRHPQRKHWFPSDSESASLERVSSNDERVRQALPQDST